MGYKALRISLLLFSLFNCAKLNAQVRSLRDSIVGLDSMFFAAYNSCDIKAQAAFYDDSLEFYHDRGGLTTSKSKLLADTEKYVCGKVTRELVHGSIEVSPIPGYGAVELGSHTFRNSEDKRDVMPHASKFVIIWRHRESKWQITRVISLH